MFELVRKLVTSAALAAYLAIAPSSVPAWRLDPAPVAVALLAVGEATPSIAYPPVGRSRLH